MMRKPVLAVVLSVFLLVFLASLAAADTIWGIEIGTGNLYRVDPLTGACTLKGPTLGPLTSVFGACRFTPTDPDIWATDFMANLYEVDTNSGFVENTIPYVGTGVDGLASNGLRLDSGGILWGTDDASLYTVNPATGATTLVGPFGVSTMWAMAWVSKDNALYGVDQLTGTFYSINTGTGAATAIGATGADRIVDIAYDPVTDRMIGSSNDDAPGNAIWLFDRATGAATMLNNKNVPDMLGLGETVPEPCTLLLFGLGGFGLIRRRRK